MEEEDSDDRNETIIEDVFDKYSSNGEMRRSQFVLVITKLSEYVPQIKGVEVETVQAAFNLFSSNGQYITLAGFKRWWCSSNKYSFFTGKKSRLLIKAYRLYKKYSSVKGEICPPDIAGKLKTSADGILPRKMTMKEFEKLLEDLNIDVDDVDDDFDGIDTDGDGVLSFKEFCAWLKWF